MGGPLLDGSSPPARPLRPARRPVPQHVAVHLHHLHGGGLGGEVEGPVATGGPEPGPKRGVAGQPPEPGGQGPLVPHGVQEPVPAVRDDLGRATGIWGHHREPGGHALDHDLAERLGDDRGVHEDVEAGQLRGHVVPETGERHPAAEPQLAHQRPHGALVLVLAEEGGADDHRLLVAVGEGLGEGPKEKVLPLPRRQAPDDAHPQ
jgi:hypothetical protein